jgi:hypothetical protein
VKKAGGKAQRLMPGQPESEMLPAFTLAGISGKGSAAAAGRFIDPKTGGVR